MSGVILPDGLDETHHPLLDQVLAVSARQKIGAGTDTHQPIVTGDQNLLRLTVTCSADKRHNASSGSCSRGVPP